MNIGEVTSGVAAPSAFTVKAFNGQRKQEEAVIGKILSSVEQSSPRSADPGKGQLVNAVA